MPNVLDRVKAALADRFSVEREIGSGGMAVVYLAEDLRHERRVAIKVLRSELASVVAAERILREIEFTSSLSHPHVLPLLDSGEADEDYSGRGGCEFSARHSLRADLPFFAADPLVRQSEFDALDTRRLRWR